MELDNRQIDLFVSAIKTSNSRMDTIIRTYMYILILGSIEIIRKPCPNLSKCKDVNPNYQGDCMHLLDDYVNSQIKMIRDGTRVLTPSS